VDTRGVKRVVVIGAGISGLSVAWGLAGKKDISVTLIESDNKAGGLSKTLECNGIRFDIGPHRFSPQLPKMVKRVRELLADDMLRKRNIHGVYYSNILYMYPPALKDFINISSLRSSFVFGISWLWARFVHTLKKMSRCKEKPSFESALIRSFGRSFCKKVVFPMISKVWGTKEMHPDFAKIRFKESTLPMILKKIIFRNKTEDNDVFYYPVKGYGEICDVIEKYIKMHGHKVELDSCIDSIEADTLNGPFKIFYTQKGAKKTADADILVSTISNKPLLKYFAPTGLVDPVLSVMDHFTSRTLRLGVFVIKDFHLSSRVVIFPEEKYIFNRICEMNQFSNLGYEENKAVLLIDVICDAGSEYDTMKEDDFNEALLKSALTLGWFMRGDVCKNFSIRIPEAYPVLNKERYDAQEVIDNFFMRSSVVLCGRQASSDYNNAHNAMCKGFFTALYIAGAIDFKEYEHAARIVGRLPIQD